MCVGRLAVCAGYLIPSQLSEALSVENVSLQLLSQYYHCFTFTSVLARWRLLIWVEYTGQLLICNTFNHHQTIPNRTVNRIVKMLSVANFLPAICFSPLFLKERFPGGWRVILLSQALVGPCSHSPPFLPVRWLLHLTLSSALSSSFFPLLFPICYFILIVWCN